MDLHNIKKDIIIMGIREKKYLWLVLILFVFWLQIQMSDAQVQINNQVNVNLEKIDWERILKAANIYINFNPVTITAFRSKRSTGGQHDYFSEGDYWWPNPKDPNGPYVRRDGISNPNNFDKHRIALRNMSIEVAALTAAYKITREEKYADAVLKHLIAWFVNANTKMNPNLEHAQAIKGVATGRGIGIIDTIHLVEVAQAVVVLEKTGYLDKKDAEAIKDWFAKYLNWLTTSKFGKDEMNNGNNHSTCWCMQVAEYAKLVGDTSELNFCRNFYKNVLLPKQMAYDGSFPKELARTKPYSYSIFNMDMMTMVCEILSDKNNDLWHYTTNDGKNIGLGMKFLYPYLTDKSKWPYLKDIMYFDVWPVRQISLLLCGIHLNESKYIKLWKRLNPDPKEEEAIRNFPIRQPVLWMN